MSMSLTLDTSNSSLFNSFLKRMRTTEATSNKNTWLRLPDGCLKNECALVLILFLTDGGCSGVVYYISVRGCLGSG